MPTGSLSATLTKAHRHLRLRLAAQTLLLWAIIALPALCLAGIADNLCNLTPLARRLVVLLLAGSAAATLLWLLARCLCRPFQPRRLAVFLEQHYGIADNSLVNAVCFQADPNLAAAWRRDFVTAADRCCANLPLRHLWQNRFLKRLAAAFLVALAVMACYAIGFADHAHNAMWRYLHPDTQMAPLHYAQFDVSPGSLTLPQGAFCRISATAAKFGKPVVPLQLLVDDGSAQTLFPMTLTDGLSSLDLPELATSLRYRVSYRNDTSNWFELRVQPRPQLDGLRLQVSPPAYTKLEGYELEAPSRRVELLIGTAVQLLVKPPRGCKAIVRNAQQQLGAGTTLTLDGTPLELCVDVLDADQLLHPRLWACQLNSFEDQAPTVRFRNRNLNVEAAPGDQLVLHLDAADDYGLAALTFYTLRDGKRHVLKTITYLQQHRQRREITVLSLDARLFPVHATVPIWAEVTDIHPSGQTGVVPAPLTVHVSDPAATMAELVADNPFAKLFASLMEILTKQQTIRDATAVQVAKAQRHHLQRLHNQQQDIARRLEHAARLATELVAANLLGAELAQAVAALGSGPASTILARIAELTGQPTGEAWQQGLNTIVLDQTGLIEQLRRLLGQLNQAQAAQQQVAAALEADAQPQQLADKLRQLQDDLAEFRDQQKELLKQTEAIDKKEPQDWTMAEEKLLGELATRQTDLAHFFEAAFNDLSKLQSQDFSNSMMAEELVELYEELQKAGAALDAKNIEIATAAEHMGVELAESIETNIERWLADKKDFIRWNAEEPMDAPDVPLQDLPAELTDIVGDLIDSVEDMTEVEDSTNSYLGSFDEGIGWGVSDGNLDDMSAKGITGNVLPNNNEVGGRSGEGRSGKSSGQFVEQEATGKGGRDTPTRLTQSPFEQGTVKDSSRDPQGGATGGGKQSGLGDLGLRGITPEQKPDVEQRLAGNQAELKQQAEALLRTLTVHNLPTGDLEQAIAGMAMLQQHKRSVQTLEFRQLQSDVISSLRDARSAADATLAAGAETNAPRHQPAPLRRIQHDADRETVPPEYQTSVDAYFKALADQ